MWQIEVFWCGKWRKLFRGEYADLAEYQKKCVGVETRIVRAEEKR